MSSKGEEFGSVLLSAEEIAAVLADTYYDADLIRQDSGEDAAAEREREVRSARRRQRMKEMRRRKKQQELIRKLVIPAIIVLAAGILLIGKGIAALLKRPAAPEITYESSLNVAGCGLGSQIAVRLQDTLEDLNLLTVRTLGGTSSQPPLRAVADEQTKVLSDELVSTNGVFIDVAAGKILAQKDAQMRIAPASMTKILTVLVAAEHITDLEDTVEITREITDYGYSRGCSSAGFEIGETVTIRDLFYGTVLPSGADAALALAVYVSGSQEAFVALMNEKIDALGLSETTHFTNCVGVHEDAHYSTVYDIAVILKAAADNSFCREVLGTRRYTTSVTEKHEEGLNLSNLFLRRIEDKDTHGEVLCAKTGFVDQSGNCAASLGIDKNGNEYICVTVNALNKWRCIEDHAALYQQFLP